MTVLAVDIASGECAEIGVYKTDSTNHQPVQLAEFYGSQSDENIPVVN
jgi:hypothetical protein